MPFCAACGQPTQQRLPPGDNRLREVCTACNTVHYDNPRLVVGTLPEWQGRVLLCRRAIEPRRGYWTLPAGFLECGESMLDGALRESREEAGASVLQPALYCLFDIPYISQVHVFYRGELAEGRFEAGIESLEAALFRPEDIPWDELAFTVNRLALEYWLQDREQGQYPVHTQVLMR